MKSANDYDTLRRHDQHHRIHRWSAYLRRSPAYIALPLVILSKAAVIRGILVGSRTQYVSAYMFTRSCEAEVSGGGLRI